MRQYYVPVILLVFFLLLPTSHADQFLTAKSAIIDTHLQSSFTTSGVKDNVSADIAFFPKKLPSQGVKDPRVTSDQLISWEQTNQSSLLVNWNVADKVVYDIAYQVGTYQVQPELNEVPYPVGMDTVLAPFLEETKFITKNDPEIKKIVAELSENVTESVELTFRIAEWVKENINYNLSTLTTDVSQDASWVLEQKTGVCDELTVLFLAMSRAAGIPSRYVAGIAYTESDSFSQNWIPHAWAEVFLPGIGWVPFDITYGQFGWVDASHIVTKTSGHIDDASLTYHWKEGDIELGPMELNGDIVNLEHIDQTVLNIKVFPLVQEVYPGSTVPVLLTAVNPTDKRVATTLRITKAPGVRGHIDIPMLVAPGTEQDAYVYIHTPKNIDTSYEYATLVEIQDRFGTIGQGDLKFGTGFGRVNYAQAKSMVERRVRSDRESLGASFYMHCSPSRVAYNPGEGGAVVCVLSGAPQEVELCLESECHKEEIKDDITITQFDIIAREEKEIRVVAKGEGEAVSYVYLQLADSPALEAELSCPARIGALESSEVELKVLAQRPVFDVELSHNKEIVKEIEHIDGEKTITYSISGESIVNNQAQESIHITYVDEEGSTYTIDKKCKINIKPLSAREVLTMWWRKITRRFANT